MGWLYGQEWDSRKKLVAHLCDEPKNYKTLARTTVREADASVLWAVHEFPMDSAAEKYRGQRFIACYLMDSDSNGWHGYKEMDETMGPCFYSCPISYLEMVPQPEGEFVQGWRDKVRQFHASRNIRKQLIASLKVGDTLKLREGCKPSEITVTSLKPLRGTHDGVLYRVSVKHVA